VREDSVWSELIEELGSSLRVLGLIAFFIMGGMTPSPYLRR